MLAVAEAVRQVMALFLSSAEGCSSDIIIAADVGTEVHCCVCISACRDGEETRMLPCGHAFHRHCVDLWLARYQRTCPLCRTHVAGGDVGAAVGVGLVHEQQQQQQLSEDLLIWISSLYVTSL